MKPRDTSPLRTSCYFIFVGELMNALAEIKLVRKFWFFALLLICFPPLPPRKLSCSVGLGVALRSLATLKCESRLNVK